jgi:mitochondrial import receptor subunit TOM40
VFLQGNLDSDLQLMGRFHVALNSQNVTKIMTQVNPPRKPSPLTNETSASQPGGVFSLEHDIQLASTSLNIKTMNPDITSSAFQGVIVASILQSITPTVALGLETAWQRQPMPALGPGAPPGLISPAETSTSFLAKFTGKDKSWVAATTLSPANGALSASFWKRLGEKIEAGASLELKAGTAAVPPDANQMFVSRTLSRVREGTATVGIKYEFRASMYRAQLDSGGRVSLFLDKRISPSIGFSFCGDLDHFKVAPAKGLAYGRAWRRSV